MSTSPDTLVGSPVPDSMAPYRSASPLDAKGVLEWVIYYVEESGHESTFPEEYGLDFGLTDVAMFYPDRIEKDGLKAPAYVGLDLQTSLDGVICDSRLYEYARNVTEGLGHHTQKDLKAEVECMLDAELERYGVDLRENKRDIQWKVNVPGARIVCHSSDLFLGRYHFKTPTNANVTGQQPPKREVHQKRQGARVRGPPRISHGRP